MRLSIILTFILCTGFTLYEWKGIVPQSRDGVLPSSHALPANGDRGPMETEVDVEAYREVYSASTVDKKYFLIDFIDWKSINPNIIPHPFMKDTWIIVGQRDNSRLKDQTNFVELVCDATFQKGMLRCTNSPVNLPVAPTPGNMCKGDLAWFMYSKGPHDSRVFYGPEAPYTIFGSNSNYTCFGQFVQDFRSLVDWGNAPNSTSLDPAFENATELQRPPPYGAIEKNFFIFWDQGGQAYAHYDVSPKRTFAKLATNGSVGEDLAPRAASNDERCMTKYMPKVRPAQDHRSESIHQATNSLSVTLCKRSDLSCKSSSRNTFIFTIFQWKSFINLRSNYEPYSMLFEQKAPFKIHGISKKPFWIHGRRTADLGEEESAEGSIEKRNNGKKPWNSSEMMYITSMSWKSHQQKYHGYLDDVVFLAFGIEDAQSAGIDVVVGDLLMDIGHCVDD